jgi:Flp pilus assembly protein protease CpaA
MWHLAALNVDFSLMKWVVVIAACAFAAITDLRSRRIPNVLTVPLFLSGIVAALVFGGGWGLLESLIAATLLMTPYLLLFLFAGGGGGDAKLMGGVGAWLGLISGMAALLGVALAGVVLAVWWSRKFSSRGEGGQFMPYGVAIGFGVCLAALGVSIGRI